MKFVKSLPKKIIRLIYFIFFILKDLFVSNLQVAFHILYPYRKFKPGVVAVPIKEGSDLQITLLSNLISLSPGILTLELSDDKKLIFVHSMFCDHKEAVIRSIQDNFEKLLIGIIQ